MTQPKGNFFAPFRNIGALWGDGDHLCNIRKLLSRDFVASDAFSVERRINASCQTNNLAWMSAIAAEAHVPNIAHLAYRRVVSSMTDFALSALAFRCSSAGDCSIATTPVTVTVELLALR